MATFNMSLAKPTHSWVPCRVIECRYHKLGFCKKAENCPFYHGLHDKRHPPDLSKTQFCPSIKDGISVCDDTEKCMYAHSKNELRKPPLKSVLCRAWLTDGNCPYSDCHYAHSFDEITTELLHPELGGVPPPPAVESSNASSTTTQTDTLPSTNTHTSSPPVTPCHNSNLPSHCGSTHTSDIPPPPPLCKDENTANARRSKTFSSFSSSSVTFKKKTSFSNVTYLPPPPSSSAYSSVVSSPCCSGDFTSLSEQVTDVTCTSRSPCTRAGSPLYRNGNNSSVHTLHLSSSTHLCMPSDALSSSPSTPLAHPSNCSSSSSQVGGLSSDNTSSPLSSSISPRCNSNATISFSIPPPLKSKTPKTYKSLFSCLSPVSSYITCTPNTHINFVNADGQSYSPHAFSTYAYDNASESIPVHTHEKETNCEENFDSYKLTYEMKLDNDNNKLCNDMATSECLQTDHRCTYDGDDDEEKQEDEEEEDEEGGILSDKQGEQTQVAEGERDECNGEEYEEEEEEKNDEDEGDEYLGMSSEMKKTNDETNKKIAFTYGGYSTDLTNFQDKNNKEKSIQKTHIDESNGDERQNEQSFTHPPPSAFNNNVQSMLSNNVMYNNNYNNYYDNSMHTHTNAAAGSVCAYDTSLCCYPTVVLSPSPPPAPPQHTSFPPQTLPYISLLSSSSPYFVYNNNNNNNTMNCRQDSVYVSPPADAACHLYSYSNGHINNTQTNTAHNNFSLVSHLPCASASSPSSPSYARTVGSFPPYMQATLPKSFPSSAATSNNAHLTNNPSTMQYFQENSCLQESTECTYTYMPSYTQSNRGNHEQLKSATNSQEAPSIHKQIEYMCNCWGREITCLTLQNTAVPPHMYAD